MGDSPPDLTGWRRKSPKTDGTTRPLALPTFARRGPRRENAEVSATRPPLRDARLDDRYTADSGPVLMSGIQALVRLLIDQRRLDLGRGLSTGMFVSGYPGSPLGGLDKEIVRAREHLDPLGVEFEPGVNEELAATAVAGTQLVAELPGRTRDGVTGFWYGKAPGLDRAADAIRHGNVSGSDHLGGAVALIGDDPLCKSSTLPSSCELMAESLMLPLLAPGTVSEIVGLGLHAVAISRAAGLWTAVKIVSDVADGSSVVQLGNAAAGIPSPPAGSRGGPPVLIGLGSVRAEHDLMSRRLGLARDYGREHALNRIVFEPDRPRLALVAPGPAFATLRRALAQLGIGDEDELERLGIRLVRLGLVWPLHADDVRAFAAGVEQLVVVEDKRPFAERQLRDLLYGEAGAPRVLGKRDADGGELIPLSGAVDADEASAALARVLGDRLGDRSSRRIPEPSRSSTPAPLPVARVPFFCSGCPHNLSTRTPEDQLVGAGIGCHALIWLDRPGRRGQILGAPQMGGEGAQWLGMAPFTCDRHYVQNMGDGTFHHSGSLAIRAAIAADSQITFRLLYNDAIAMTGGQPAPGRLGVPELVRWLDTEGVRQVIVTTEDVESFDGVALPPGASVRDRSQLQDALKELEAVDGVTVLIHTDRCATEERRLRKRGKLPTPAQRVWINERVCEGCGDCGDKSSCLSVVPVATEYGRKTRIHQSSCTQDLACLDGDCPSFVVVTPADLADRPARPVPDPAGPLPEPHMRFDADQHVVVRMPGVGGTGVVTASQILQMAALLQGRWSTGLDQTGLAQKGGPVISDVRIGPAADDGAARAAGGEVDVLLGLELLGAVAPETLRTLDPARTVAVVNIHETATAAMVADVEQPPLPLQECVARVQQATVADEALFVDAGALSESLFGDHMPVNVMMLGVAYQQGCLPLDASAIERAIELNAAAVARNLRAFAWGRALAADPAGTLAAVAAAIRPAAATVPTPPPAAALPWSLARAIEAGSPPDSLGELLRMRAGDLCDYQDARYARRYVADVLCVLAAERRAGAPGLAPVAEAYARSLHKLMAYKDEYEVARLHLDAVERARREAEFGPGARPRVMLHPPLLRALGMRRKLGLPESTAQPLFTALRAGRRLRGTPLDPFGRTSLLRLERALVDEHRTLTRRALTQLRPATAGAVAEIAGLADMIRGYEQVKVRSVDRYRAAAAERLGALGVSRPDVPGRGPEGSRPASARPPAAVQRRC
jgi:indolepyruvate ferredoxin oxidoreductase